MAPPPADNYDIADPADRLWVASLLTPHPLRTCTEPLSLSNAPLADRVFLSATGYRHDNFRRYAEGVHNDAGWSTHAVAGGHDLMIDAPDEVAAILIAAASRSAGS